MGQPHKYNQVACGKNSGGATGPPPIGLLTRRCPADHRRDFFILNRPIAGRRPPGNRKVISRSLPGRRAEKLPRFPNSKAGVNF